MIPPTTAGSMAARHTTTHSCMRSDEGSPRMLSQVPTPQETASPRYMGTPPSRGTSPMWKR